MIERDVFVTAWIYDCAFFGTLAPFFRASDSPIAIACLRLFTVPPLPPFPERRVPFFSRRTALSTDFPAAFPYLRLLNFLCAPAFFRVAILSSPEVCLGPAIGCPQCGATMRQQRFPLPGTIPITSMLQEIICVLFVAELLCRRTQSRAFDLPVQNECSRWSRRSRTVRLRP